MKLSRTQRRFGPALVIAGIVAACIITSVSAAYAQPQCEVPCPDVGQVKCCPGSSISTLQANGGTISFTATTNGCFLITSCTPPAGCQWSVNMDIQSFTGTGTDPGSGLTVNWRNDSDPAKVSTGSYLEALTAASQFPAKGYIEFWVEADVSGVPGVYHSTTQVRLENDNITTWDPFVQEAFKMPAGTQVELVNDKTGDSIILTDLTSILN